MMRAAALGQMGNEREAKASVEKLLTLNPDFEYQARRLIGRYIKVDELIDMVFEGLRKAGLEDLSSLST